MAQQMAALDMADITTTQAVAEAKDTLERKGVADAPRWARALVAFVRGVPHTALAVQGHEPLTGAQAEHLQDLLKQVTPDAPVAYLIGRAPFLDWDFEVTRDTLICKSDTELFVELVLSELEREPLPPDPNVLELCTGSGCVAIAFAHRLPGSRVVATDLSPEALAVARRNVARFGLEDRITLGQGDMFEPVRALMAGRPFDLIVSNPPYIPTENIPTMGRHVAEHEPHLALDGGADGLDPHRRILAAAADYLAPGGRLFLEHEHCSGEAARALAAGFPAYVDVRTFQDANGRDRALYARRAATHTFRVS